MSKYSRLGDDLARGRFDRVLHGDDDGGGTIELDAEGDARRRRRIGHVRALVDLVAEIGQDAQFLDADVLAGRRRQHRLKSQGARVMLAGDEGLPRRPAGLAPAGSSSRRADQQRDLAAERARSAIPVRPVVDSAACGESMKSSGSANGNARMSADRRTEKTPPASMSWSNMIAADPPGRRSRVADLVDGQPFLRHLDRRCCHACRASPAARRCGHSCIALVGRKRDDDRPCRRSACRRYRRCAGTRCRPGSRSRRWSPSRGSTGTTVCAGVPVGALDARRNAAVRNGRR